MIPSSPCSILPNVIAWNRTAFSTPDFVGQVGYHGMEVAAKRHLRSTAMPPCVGLSRNRLVELGSARVPRVAGAVPATVFGCSVFDHQMDLSSGILECARRDTKHGTPPACAPGRLHQSGFGDWLTGATFRVRISQQPPGLSMFHRSSTLINIRFTSAIAVDSRRLRCAQQGVASEASPS